MPLVRISITADKPDVYRMAVSEGIHQAMIDSINIPIDDRFQLITEHAAGWLIYDRNYLGIDRSDDFVAIQISMRRGRTPEMKQALYRNIATNLSRNPGVRPEDVMVTLLENDLADWSFGNGEAQYLK